MSCIVTILKQPDSITNEYKMIDTRFFAQGMISDISLDLYCSSWQKLLYKEKEFLHTSDNFN